MEQSKYSGLPVASGDLEKAKRAVAKIEKPEQADEVKIMLATIQKLYKKRGLFEEAFKASELWIEADQKLYKLISQSSLTDKVLAKALNTTTGSVKSIRHELKRAYDKPTDNLKNLKDKAFEDKIYLTRKIFIQNGWIGGSGDDEYYTPKYIVEACRRAMGGVIDLDPASNKKAQKIVKAKRYFTKEDDGLKQKWAGNVFCNPPYSNLNGFADKLVDSLVDIKEAVFIGRMDVGTKWGQKLLKFSNAICIPRARIQFYDADGIVRDNNNMSSIIIGFYSDDLRFSLGFGGIGQVIVKKDGLTPSKFKAIIA